MASIPNLATVTPLSQFRLFPNVDVDMTYRNVHRFHDNNERDLFYNSPERNAFIVNDAKLVRMPERIRLPYSSEWIRKFNYISFKNSMSYSYDGTPTVITNTGINGGSPDNETMPDVTFYAFIKSVEWVNIQCCDVFYEIDIFTTYFWSISPLMSFVNRSHLYQTPDEKIGDNIQSENLSVEHYKRYVADFDRKVGLSSQTCVFRPRNGVYPILIGINPRDFNLGSDEINGIYGALKYALADNVLSAKTFLLTQNTDSIIVLSNIPWLFLEMFGGGVLGLYEITTNVSPLIKEYTFTNTQYLQTINGYVPKNKKCFTYPFCFMEISTPDGQKITLKYEDFDQERTNNSENITLCLKASLIGEPTVILTPVDYEPVGMSGTITVDNYIVSPSYTLVLPTVATCIIDGSAFMNYISSGQMLGDNIDAFATLAAGYNGTWGTLETPDNISGLVGTVTRPIKEFLKPDSTKGNSNNAANMALGVNTFFISNIATDALEIKKIDDYFEMFGYAVNELIVPDFNIRPYWCYYEIPDFNFEYSANVDYSVPPEAIATIKSRLAQGITFWDTRIHYGDYSQNNHTE